MPFPRATLLIASALLTLSVANAAAQLPSPPAVPDAVEEDWVLVVATPDPLGVGPQVTTVMSPDGGDPNTFVAFDLDYIEYPTFFPGGMQIQVWSAGKVIGTSAQGNALLNTPGETVTWTQRMSVSGGTLVYDINNGSSVTWGNFGAGDKLSVSFPTALTTLAGYDRGVSAARSGVSWEQNLVSTLTLRRVRYYANGQLIVTDNTPKVLVDNTAPN